MIVFTEYIVRRNLNLLLVVVVVTLSQAAVLVGIDNEGIEIGQVGKRTLSASPKAFQSQNPQMFFNALKKKKARSYLPKDLRLVWIDRIGLPYETDIFFS